MLKKERQFRHLMKFASAAQFHMNTFVKTQNAEELHKFRVEIKKMKAVLAFNKIKQKKSEATSLSYSARKMYQLAGEIRQLDIHLHIINDFNFAEPDLIANINKLRKQKISRLKLFYIKHEEIFSKSDHNLFKQVKNFDNETMVTTIEKKISKMKNTLPVQLKKEEYFHSVRKKIKRLIYVEQILPRQIQTKLNLDLLYLDILQHSIGEWHDLYSTETYLKTGYQNLDMMLTKLKHARRVHVKKIQSQFKKFNKKVKL